MNIQTRPQLTVYRKDKPYDLSEFLQFMQIKKSLRDPVGSFNISLNPTLSTNGRVTVLTNKIVNEIYSLLSVNDVVAGKIDGSSKRHSFVGLTSQFKESRVQVNNQTSRGIIVNGGLAFPKALVRDTIAFAPQIAEAPEIKGDKILQDRAKFFEWQRGFLEDGTSVFMQEPEKIIKWILNNCLATHITIYNDNRIQVLFPTPLDNVKDYKGAELSRFKFLTNEKIYDKNLSTYTGPIIKYIYECLDEEFYEMYFDTTTGANGVPYNTINIRTKPLSHKDVSGYYSVFGNWTNWEDLFNENDMVTVADADVMQSDLGKDDYNLKNFFRLNYSKTLQAYALGQLGVSYPVFNVNSIKRHGLREMTVNSSILPDVSQLVEVYKRKINSAEVPYFPEILTEYAPLSSPETKSAGDKFFKGLLQKRDKLKEWYAFPYYERGTIRAPHNEEISIGKLINLPEYQYYYPFDQKIYKGTKFYCTDVLHTFSYGKITETNATVDYGQPDGIVKKWLDDPENQFAKSPMERQKLTLPVKTYPKTFYDKMAGTNVSMLTITEVPSE